MAKLKQTGPGIITIPLSQPKPSRPQAKVHMGVGGRKGKAKGRTDPKAANPHDPGPTPMPNTTINYVTADKNVQKGYVVGKAWPESNKKSAEFEPSASLAAPHA